MREFYFGLCVFVALLAPAYFDIESATVNATTGQTVVLDCRVLFSQDYQVSWIRLWEDLVVLTYRHERITPDTRFSLLNPSINEWNLQITNVSMRDQGNYSCTINTDPPVSKLVTLNVNAPPTIIFPRYTNERIELLENEMTTLMCNSTGNPRPTITWYRKSFVFDPEKKQKFAKIPDFIEVGKGPTLTVSGTRFEEDQYKCEANNSVVSDLGLRTYRVFDISIHFRPKVKVSPPEIGQSRNGETLLDCEVNANPVDPNDLFWEHEGKRITVNSTNSNYHVELYPQTQPYTVIMALRISPITDNEFGVYYCRVSNKYGNASSSCNVYEIKKSTAKQIPKVYPTLNEPSVPVTSTAKAKIVVKTTRPMASLYSTRRYSQRSEMLPREQRPVAVAAISIASRNFAYSFVLIISSGVLSLLSRF